MVTKRTFHGGRACSLRCAYCFAKIPEYHEENLCPPLDSSASPEGEILYPVCDSELQFNKNVIPVLSKRAKKAEHPLFVSISTKTRLSDSILQSLSSINNHLLDSRRGFVKIAVSASCYSQESVGLYESGCASFEERLSALHKASEMGLSVAITLKPVLPHIATTEYTSLISEVTPYIGHFVVGGLYCSTKTKFGRDALARFPALVSERRVDWLSRKPLWKYIEDPLKMDEIKSCIVNSGARWFDSDQQLMLRLWDGLQKRADCPRLVQTG